MPLMSTRSSVMGPVMSSHAAGNPSARHLKGRLGAFRLASSDRVYSMDSQLATVHGGFASLGEADRVERAEAHLALFLPLVAVRADRCFGDGVSKEPTLIDPAIRSSLDLEIEAAAVGVHSSVLRSPDLGR